MVTRPSPGRLDGLKQSLLGYAGQTWRRRDLVVVVDAAAQGSAIAAAKAEIAALGREDIRILEPETGQSLGALRNISTSGARGEVFCQWDDDDLYHPERLERQLEALIRSGAEAVGLQEVMQFFPSDRSLYCTNWRATPATAHPGTLMRWAASPVAYPETGAAASLGEDLDVVMQLQRRGAFAVLAGAPHLHVYVSHGENSWDGGHHRMLADSLGLSQGLLRRREAPLREALSVFDFGPGEVTVRGPAGPAFVMDGRA
jgi:glycosyltransferase involved in cell wall biosynthesis